MKDYYGILNIQEDATDQEIKKGYYMAMKEWHPDRNAHRIEEATARSKEIVEAYTVLLDHEERLRYDSERIKSMGKEEEEKYFNWRYHEYDNNFEGMYNFSPRKFNPNMSEEEFKKFLVQESIRLFQEWNEERNRRVQLGEKLLIAAALAKWKELDQYLAQGADLDACITAEHCFQLGLGDSYIGYTALHIVIWQDSLKVDYIKKLIENGAPVNAQTENGMAPLHLLLCRSPHPSILELVELLVKKGAFPHFLSKKGNSPLHIAIEKKHFKEALFLIKNPSWTRSIFARRESSNMRKNGNGLSPLELTVQCIIDTEISREDRDEYWKIVAALLKRGNEVEVPQVCLDQMNKYVMEKRLVVPDYIREAMETNRRVRDESIRNQLGCSLM